MGNSNFRILFPYLQECKTVISVNFSKNKLNDESLELLYAYLQKN
jgi:hypothetical protein